MTEIVFAVLVALKIAGVGSYSWWLPFGILIAGTVLGVLVGYFHDTDKHPDWHKGMFD